MIRILGLLLTVFIGFSWWWFHTPRIGEGNWIKCTPDFGFICGPTYGSWTIKGKDWRIAAASFSGASREGRFFVSGKRGYPSSESDGRYSQSKDAGYAGFYSGFVWRISPQRTGEVVAPRGFSFSSRSLFEMNSLFWVEVLPSDDSKDLAALVGIAEMEPIFRNGFALFFDPAEGGGIVMQTGNVEDLKKITTRFAPTIPWHYVTHSYVGASFGSGIDTIKINPRSVNRAIKGNTSTSFRKKYLGIEDVFVPSILSREGRTVNDRFTIRINH